jgi:hypothetical protein
MAVKASYSITIASIDDVTSTARYYLLQSSTLAAPSKPTASPPGGSWQTTEPTYTEGSTNSLYFTDETIFSDGTWAYSDVSLSTSYEAAKAAYNKAVAAQALATAINNYFNTDSSGAHIGTVEGNPNSGLNLLLAATKIALRSATTELATFAATAVELGKNSPTAIIKFCAGNGLIGYDTTSKQLYLCGTDGAYLARKTDIDNGNDSGIGLVDDNGSAKAVMVAAKYEVAGVRLTAAQMATALAPKVLFSGDTNGNITLSETAANFSKLKIFFKTNQYDAKSSIEVPSPNGSNVSMFCCTTASGGMVIAGRVANISGKSITSGSGSYGVRILWDSGVINSYSDNNIYILRVEGIR